MKFTNEDKRWLEIIFYLICNKVFSINNEQSDVIKFIEGYTWTNMFNCDTLITAIEKEKLLINSQVIPSKHEFIITMDHPKCRLRLDKQPIRELIRDTSYKYYNKDVFHAKMKEEIIETPLIPKLQTPKIHETIYSFLLALRYIADIVKKIKF